MRSKRSVVAMYAVTILSFGDFRLQTFQLLFSIPNTWSFIRLESFIFSWKLADHNL